MTAPSYRRGHGHVRRASLSLIALVVAAIACAVGATSALAAAGAISTVAGNGTLGFSGDGGPATAAEIGDPRGLSPLPGGGFLIADFFNHRIREVSPDGTITTVAGTGTSGFTQSGTATSAMLNLPRSVSLLPAGGFLIAEHGSCTIQKVDPAGMLTTVAGTGTCGTGTTGDGGPATSANLSSLTNVAALPNGGFLFSDGSDYRIREVSPAGILTTVAGTGTAGFSGDGGPATQAKLTSPRGIAPLAGGGFLIADQGNNRIREVSPAGVITTVAGNGTGGYAGDGGPAAAAELKQPEDVVLNPAGGYLIADFSNSRVRLVEPGLPAAVITSPQSDHTYTVGQRVPTSFSCSDDSTGPGLASCRDGNGDTAPGGHLDTRAPGPHVYVVTATSKDGLRSTASITYSVVRPRVAIRGAHARVKNGEAKLKLSCRGASSSRCHGVLSLSFRLKHPGHRTTTIRLGKAHYSIAAGAGHQKVSITLTHGALKLLDLAPNHRLHVRATATVSGGKRAHRTVTLKLPS